MNYSANIHSPKMLDLDLLFAVAKENPWNGLVQWTLPSCTSDIVMKRNPFRLGCRMNTWIAELSPLGPKEPSPGRQKASNTAIHLSQDQQNYSAELQILSIDPIIVCHWDFVTIMKQFHNNNGLTTEALSGSNICVWFRVEVKIGYGNTMAKIR